ncbi:MAG: hypothetical protein WCT26_01370 [Candidatus Buchananbacteria bacterium]|jgi:hypothetical protein
MELCGNGAIREDYEIIRRVDGKRMAIKFATSKEQALTAWLTQTKKPRHEGERQKYTSRPLATECERERFRQQAAKPTQKQQILSSSAHQLPLDFSGEEIDF